GGPCDDVRAGGNSATIVPWGGTAWSAACSGPTTAVLYGVWGSASTVVWAVGWDNASGAANDAILHWDGSAWSAVSSGITAALNGVWGSASTDVWAVGSYPSAINYGAIAYSDAKAWTDSSE